MNYGVKGVRIHNITLSFLHDLVSMLLIPILYYYTFTVAMEKSFKNVCNFTLIDSRAQVKVEMTSCFSEAKCGFS